MVANVMIEENALNMALKALTSKMGELNSCRLISGSFTDRMQEDYELCEEAYDALTKGLEGLENAKTMMKDMA